MRVLQVTRAEAMELRRLLNHVERVEPVSVAERIALDARWREGVAKLFGVAVALRCSDGQDTAIKVLYEPVPEGERVMEMTEAEYRSARVPLGSSSLADVQAFFGDLFPNGKRRR